MELFTGVPLTDLEGSGVISSAGVCFAMRSARNALLEGISRNSKNPEQTLINALNVKN